MALVHLQGKVVRQRGAGSRLIVQAWRHDDGAYGKVALFRRSKGLDDLVSGFRVEELGAVVVGDKVRLVLGGRQHIGTVVPVGRDIASSAIDKVAARQKVLFLNGPDIETRQLLVLLGGDGAVGLGISRIRQIWRADSRVEVAQAVSVKEALEAGRMEDVRELRVRVDELERVDGPLGDVAVVAGPSDLCFLRRGLVLLRPELRAAARRVKVLVDKLVRVRTGN